MDSITNPSSVRLELSRKFDALPIFKRDRATALYYLCAALEMSTNPYTVDPDLVTAMGRRALEASMRAIPAIYRNCSAASAASQIQFNPAAFAEAMEVDPKPGRGGMPQVVTARHQKASLRPTRRRPQMENEEKYLELRVT